MQFHFEDDGGVFLNGEARLRFLREYSQRLKSSVRDVSTGKKTSFERHVDEQAEVFAAELKGQGCFGAFELGR